MWSSSPTSIASSKMLETAVISFYNRSIYPPIRYVTIPYKTRFLKTNQTSIRSGNGNGYCISCCSSSDADSHILPSTTTPTPTTTVVTKRRKRYRKQYPGESKGIVEEMRFVTMKLRNNENSKKGEEEGAEMREDEGAVPSSSGDDDVAAWQPSMDGFLKYLVDSKLVFDTLERIIDESNDVACKRILF